MSQITELDFVYGPEFKDNEWRLGNVKVEFNKDNIVVGDKSFEYTTGLYELIFSKDPRHFSAIDHQFYKEILELSGVHRDSRGYLKNQASKTKFNRIIRPLFKNKTKYSREQLLNKEGNMNEIKMIDDEVEQSSVQNKLLGKCREDQHAVMGKSLKNKTKYIREQALNKEGTMNEFKMIDDEGEQSIIQNGLLGKCDQHSVMGKSLLKSQGYFKGKTQVLQDPNEIINEMRLVLSQGKPITKYVTTLVKMNIIEKPNHYIY